MKKFISMVMAAAMVVSLVPATAFAATGYVSADKILVNNAADKAEDFGSPVGFIDKVGAPEVQIVLDDVVGEKTGSAIDAVDFDITYTVDGAEFKNENGADFTAEGALYLLSINKQFASSTSVNGEGEYYATINGATVTVTDVDDNTVTFNVVGTAGASIKSGEVIALDLRSTMDDTDEGSVATVSVESEIVGAELTDAVYAEVKEEGIDATLKGDLAEVAEEESETIAKQLKIESNIGYFADNQLIKLTLSNGFEFEKGSFDPYMLIGADDIFADDDEEDVAWVEVNGATVDTVIVKPGAFKIDAVDAKAGDTCVITVKAVDKDAADNKLDPAVEGEDEVEALVVVGEGFTMELDDPDEDLPVIYSGVAVNNAGITDNSKHESLKVHFEETVKEALDTKKAFTLTLTEGVFVTDVTVSGQKMNGVTVDGGNLKEAFAVAYKEGEQEAFEFARKTFNNASASDAMEFDVVFDLVAVPGFEGDVTLTLDGAAFDEPVEVTIATFVAPYKVEAQANDLIIDYRNTEVPTEIVITEAEAGLWDENSSVLSNDGLEFTFEIERFNDNAFEGDATFTVNEESGMELDVDNDGLKFEVDEESDDEAAVITISDISLYMGRSIAAGAYDLELGTNAAAYLMTAEKLFTTEKGEGCACSGSHTGRSCYVLADFAGWDWIGTSADGNVNGWEAEKATVKEGFVNVITAGRDQDDASFTKKVVVPVGESYIVAGEETVTLDVPAYVSAAGYTMLPVRAVAVALGINTNNVLWDQATKTVTILYGQRIITMTVGSKAINVNGSAIPASASPEVVDGRTFLPMRDLATALGVTDITWDAATKTATLNGNK